MRGEPDRAEDVAVVSGQHHSRVSGNTRHHVNGELRVWLGRGLGGGPVGFLPSREERVRVSLCKRRAGSPAHLAAIRANRTSSSGKSPSYETVCPRRLNLPPPLLKLALGDGSQGGGVDPTAQQHPNPVGSQPITHSCAQELIKPLDVIALSGVLHFGWDRQLPVAVDLRPPTTPGQRVGRREPVEPTRRPWRRALGSSQTEGSPRSRGHQARL